MGWRPTVGSSNTNTDPSWLLPISEASFSLWASPPDSAGVDSPRVRYPSPISDSVRRRSATFVPESADTASSTVIAMICGRV